MRCKIERNCRVEIKWIEHRYDVQILPASYEKEKWQVSPNFSLDLRNPPHAPEYALPKASRGTQKDRKSIRNIREAQRSSKVRTSKPNYAFMMKKDPYLLPLRTKSSSTCANSQPQNAQTLKRLQASRKPDKDGHKIVRRLNPRMKSSTRQAHALVRWTLGLHKDARITTTKNLRKTAENAHNLPKPFIKTNNRALWSRQWRNLHENSCFFLTQRLQVKTKCNTSQLTDAELSPRLLLVRNIRRHWKFYSKRNLYSMKPKFVRGESTIPPLVMSQRYLMKPKFWLGLWTRSTKSIS